MEISDDVPKQETGAAEKTDAEWQAELTREQFRVLRHAGTESPFGPAYEQFKHQGAGTYSKAKDSRPRPTSAIASMA